MRGSKACSARGRPATPSNAKPGTPKTRAPTGRDGSKSPPSSLGVDGVRALPPRRAASPKQGRAVGSAAPKPERGAMLPRPAQRQPSLPAEAVSGVEGMCLESFSSDSSTAFNSAPELLGPPPPMLALLQAAPLVHNGQPVDVLDLKNERDVVVSAMRRSGKRLEVVCDFCTTRRLLSLLTDGCRMLHYSGHGFSYVDRNGAHRSRLAFENGEGGTHALEAERLTEMVQAGAHCDEGRPPLDFVFVSACHSVGGGEAFIAAGVPHVVAVRREAQLQDKAACIFAEALYFALFKGRSVQQAFDIGKQAVRNTPNILRPGEESDKFLLLPADGDHSVGLFKDLGLFRDLPDGALVDSSPTPCANNLPAFFPLQFVGRQPEWQQLVSAATGNEKRLLSLVGAPGLGKTSLALAAAHYLCERSTFPGGIVYVHAEGASTADELAAAMRAALLEARLPCGADAAADADGDGSLPQVLRALGRCLLLIDHFQPQPSSPDVRAGRADAAPHACMQSLLRSLLDRAPSLVLLVTCSEPLALPGVAQRQLLLSPMPPAEAARLFRALAPRPVSRAELGCDEPHELRAEIERLLREVGPRLPGLERFAVMPPHAAPADTPAPLRVQWRLADLSAAAALHRELSATPSLLQLDTPPVSASGRAALYGFLSLSKVLARHPALLALGGNPKAISLSVALLVSGMTPRPLDDLGGLLAAASAGAACAPLGAHNGADGRDDGAAEALERLPDHERLVLEQLQPILWAEGGADAAEPPGLRPIHSEGAPLGSGRRRARTPPAPGDECDGDGEMQPAAVAAARSRAKLPSSLVLRKDDYLSMMSDRRWLGSGSLGAVYDVYYDRVGTRVAVKKFNESACSSSAFQREASLLGELRHPNVVQLIKVHCRPPLCIVTELLVCSLHALIHHGAGGALRETLLARPAVLPLYTHIARGMNYLHTLEPPVLHRNLKSQNLLVDEGGKIKIADFGWSKLSSTGTSLGKTFFHGWQWVAPEILGGGRYTEKADVYSFAMVAWEVLEQKLPFEGKNPVQIGLAVREQKLRPPIADDAPAGFAELLCACWHDEPEQRHTFSRILGALQALAVLAE